MEDSLTTAKSRLDLAVLNKIPKLSRSAITNLIKDGKVTVNGIVQQKSGFKVSDADKVLIDFDLDQAKNPPAIKLPIVYEDDDCIVINKPEGILTHSKGAFNPEATVASWLRPYLKDIVGDRAGIVHRLDRATSGVMICAKTDQAMRWLQKQFSTRKVKKTYEAIINGSMEPNQAVIDMPIERNPKHPATFRVGHNGKQALTAYETTQQTGKYTLLILKPTTGRTHQLRVHLSQLGHPIVGDVLYGGEPADRLYLHAEELEITLPNRERKTFFVPLPSSFEQLLEQA